MPVHTFGHNWWNSSVFKSNWLHVNNSHGICESELDCIVSLNVEPLPHCQIHYHMLISCLFVNQKAYVDVQITLGPSRIKGGFTWAHFWHHVCRFSLSAMAFLFLGLVQYNQGRVEC